MFCNSIPSLNYKKKGLRYLEPMEIFASWGNIKDSML